MGQNLVTKKLLWRRRRCRLLLVLAILFPCTFIITLVVLGSQTDNELIATSQLRQNEYVDKRGIHVIVAHYHANNFPWENVPNLTRDLLNHNYFSPIPGEGELGEPVYLPKFEVRKAKVLYHINKFNLVVSDRISLDRKLPDVRKPECKDLNVSVSSLPNTSIIIVFHNEAWSTLLRTVHSVINNSPKELIHEIILVNDASERAFLGKALEDHVANLSTNVHVLHLFKRSGLIRARLKGASIAKGEVLTFLDAHCECTTGWLEPLLHRIAQNRSNVVCPIIDIINDENFSYMRSFDIHWGAFNWALHFRWYGIDDASVKAGLQNSTSPFRTPVMAGGLFAISRTYFEELGQYDPQMDIWGGENIELSFRIWMCGGSLEIVPCSHVGHIFRKSSPYTFPGGIGSILSANLARVAEVWMDDWKNFFFKVNPEAAKVRKNLQLEDRINLRKKLECKSFQWYLENVWPKHFFPTSSTFFGKIRNKKSGNCIQRPQAKKGSSTYIGNAITYLCSFELYSPQLFVISTKGYIMTDENVCLDLPNPILEEPNIVFLACNQHSHQQWTYDLNSGALIHKQTGLCLDLPVKSGDTLTVHKCKNVESQVWIFESVNWQS